MNYRMLCYSCFRDRGSDVRICPYCGFDNGSDPAPGTLPYGTILHGRYTTGQILGVGGFGATYLVYDMKLEKKCACKEYLPSGMAARAADRYTMSVLRSEQRGAYEDGMEKFLDEARILARLEHIDGIVSVQDHFRENGTAYFVMEYVDGVSLKEHIRRSGGRLTYEEVAHISLPVMRALQQVHAQQLLHRDISPDNILITHQNRPILLDFGAARSGAGQGATMSVILKHGFAPQEQYSTHGNQGPWTDVYALGATMYYALTGSLPPDAIDRMQNDRILPPSALGIQILPAAERALMKALAVRPEERYASMAAFAESIQAGAAERSVRKAQPPARALHAAGAQPPMSAAQPARSGVGVMQKLKRWIRAHRPIVIAGIVAGVLLVALLSVIGGRARNRDAGQADAATASSGGTEIPGNRAVYEAEDAALTFQYIPDEAEISESEEGNAAGHANVFVSYHNAEFEIARMGSDTAPREWLEVAEESMTEDGYTVYGNPVQAAQLGNRSYLYTVFKSDEDEMYCAMYATDVKGETILIFDYIDGSQSEAQQQQFAVVASTVDLLREFPE